jgi:hypothetical protein
MINLANALETQAAKDIINKNYSVPVGIGCSIEYNMNSMIENVSVYSTNLDSEYTSGITGGWTKASPYKKLFPVDTIIRPFRPIDSGIKYFIVPSNSTNFSYKDPKSVYYNLGTARIYYPGFSNKYKYWVSPEGKNAKLVVKYTQSTAKITEATSSNPTKERVAYVTEYPHGFVVNNTVKITGMSNAAFNITGVITEVPDTKTFVLAKNIAASDKISSQSGTATLVLSETQDTAISTKPAIANKIIISFEKNHNLPTSVIVKVKHLDDTEKTTTISSFNTTFPSGQVILYAPVADGNWTTSTTNVYTTPKFVKSIEVEATAPSSTAVMAVTEISARWIKDVTSLLVMSDINKESSSSSEDILPVGKISSNTATISFSNYNQEQLMIIPYSKSNPWNTGTGVTEFDFLYMVKNAEVKPYFKISNSTNTYSIPQGTYYADSWEIDQYGNTSLTALDGAKYLMESIPQSLLLEQYSSTAVIRTLLDSVGFTNYNFNFLFKTENNQVVVTDTSIPNISYFWTDETKTVWEILQEICRDIQMNAFFDENNILQFYSRDKIYSQSSSVWSFYEKPEGEILPNIVTMAQSEIPSANQVKLLWIPVLTTEYLGDAAPLAQANTAYLSAGGLAYPITAESSAENTDLIINNSTMDEYGVFQAGSSFSGFFLIDDEIIEFDALEYQYVGRDENVYTVWIGSQSDVDKYLALSKPGAADVSNYARTVYFRPTGRYRVKTRGALGTKPAAHSVVPIDVAANNGWKEVFLSLT